MPCFLRRELLLHTIEHQDPIPYPAAPGRLETLALAAFKLTDFGYVAVARIEPAGADSLAGEFRHVDSDGSALRQVCK